MSTKITIEKIAHNDRARHKEFIDFQHQLYANNRHWVPMFNIDLKQMLRRTHPYYRVHPAEFFLARKGGKVAGTISVAYNKAYIDEHKIPAAHFFFFETKNDIEVATALFNSAKEWARTYNLSELLGPIQSGASVGSGMLVEGFDKDAPMTMMRYNHSYYPEIMEKLGFKKHIDLLSMLAYPSKFKFPEKFQRVADAIEKRGNFKIVEKSTKRALLKDMNKYVTAYMDLLQDHPENYPLAPIELKRLVSDVKPIITTDLIKGLSYKDKIVGFVLSFPDCSKVLKKHKGKLSLSLIFNMGKAMKNYDKLICNGIGVLDEYQRLGGAALMYKAIYEVGKKSANLKEVIFIQMAETTTAMLQTMDTIKTIPYQCHRMYRIQYD